MEDLAAKIDTLQSQRATYAVVEEDPSKSIIDLDAALSSSPQK
jgi:hypothetical protein